MRDVMMNGGAAVIMVVMCGASCARDDGTDCRVAPQRWNAPPELSSACRLVEIVHEHADQERTDWRVTFSYDQAGRLLTEEIDEPIDGTIDGRVAYGYDAEGRMAFTESEFALGGWREQYEYDHAGDRIAIDFIWSEGLHSNARYTYEYDSSGNVLVEGHDWDNDGVSDTDITKTYDGCNPLIETHRLSGGSLQVFRYTYDAAGNLVTLDRDDTNDGENDARTTYTHDADGNIATEQHYGRSGALYARVVYTYDGYGNRLTSARDDDLDGVPDVIVTFTYDCR